MNPSTSWFTALCSVVFDLRVGQKIQQVIPSGALTAKEETDIAFHTFPDSLSQELRLCASVRDSCFFFRIRRHRILYGFVFCRQRQDERLARGMDRRAVVVVSPFPFHSVLRPLSTYLGAIYFAEGTEGLERVYDQILSWPVPQFCRLLQLNVTGHTIHANLPPIEVFPPPAPKTSGPLRQVIPSFRQKTSMGISVEAFEPTTALFNDVDVYIPFRNLLTRLWSLWELTIAGQPLAIVAPSPVECSAAVAALISLISPIPYASDFRPFFTIHDPEFPTLLQTQDMQEANEWNHQWPTLLGVTNLYFIKALPLWPNVLSIGDRQPIQNATNVTSTAGKTSFRIFSPKTAFQSFKSRTMGAQILLSHHVENLWSSRKLLMKPDVEMCKDMQLKSGHPGQHSDTLRRHFSALTTAFLEPFRGYFVPVQASECIDGGHSVLSLEASGLPEFDRSEFLSSIVDWPFPSLLRNRFQSMQDMQLFYEHFLDSPNFKIWFGRQQKMVASDLGLPQTHRSGDLEQATVGSAFPSDEDESKPATHQWDCTDEVRLVEEFRRLQSELMNEMQEISPDSSSNLPPSQYEREFIHVFSAMPDDLRRILLSSPAQFDFVKRLQRIPDIQDYLPECITVHNRFQ